MQKSKQIFCRLNPCISDQLMTRRSRMNSIRRPVRLRSTLERLIEKFLQRNMDRPELFREFNNDFSAFDEFRNKDAPFIDMDNASGVYFSIRRPCQPHGMIIFPCRKTTRSGNPANPVNDRSGIGKIFFPEILPTRTSPFLR